MEPSNKAGFTIIETMLFLGISGLLAVGVFVGVGTSINNQRYRDSVTSLQSILQQQYSGVSNVSNDNVGDLACYGDGTIMPRGQSNCVILGRLIKTSNNSTLSIQDVVGYIPLGSTSSLNDIDIFKGIGYNIRVSFAAGSTYDLEWGASMKRLKPADSQDLNFSILVLRSPSSGVVRTFINPTVAVADSAIISMVTKESLANQAKICISPSSVVTGSKMAVVVEANATSANNVETLGDDSGC